MNLNANESIMDISIFDITEPFTTKRGSKILSREPYAKELAEIYEAHFSKESLNFSLTNGELIKGIITNISSSEISIDLNQREFAYVSISRDKLDVNNFHIGQEIEAIVIEDQESSTYLKASITDMLKKEIYDDMMDWKSTKVYPAKVLNLSNNGYDLDIHGIKVFMPGSLGGINKLVDFNTLVGKTINVMTVKNNNNYSKYKDTLIVSHREYLKSLIPNELAKLQVGERYSGFVTDTTKFGIFVEFNEVLTGLIHKDEFDEQLKELFDTNKIESGIEIEFYLKEVVTASRIILSRKEVEISHKEKIKYTKGDKVKGRVSKVTTYGAFIKFESGVSGLLHISKMKDVELVKGDLVNCAIINVNNDKYDLDIIK